MLDPDLARLLSLTWEGARLLEGRIPGYGFLGDCLDSSSQEIFEFGDFCHTNAEGNRMVALSMAELIINSGCFPDSVLKHGGM